MCRPAHRLLIDRRSDLVSHLRASRVQCGTTPRAIEDSIVAGNFPAPGGAQTVGACLLERVVVGGVELDADGRLTDSAANEACCLDKSPAAVDHDCFGTARPQGPAADIGAHELVRTGS